MLYTLSQVHFEWPKLKEQIPIPHICKHRFSFSLTLWRLLLEALFWVPIFLPLLEVEFAHIKIEDWVLSLPLFFFFSLYPILPLYMFSKHVWHFPVYLLVKKRVNASKVHIMNIRIFLVIWRLYKGMYRRWEWCLYSTAWILWSCYFTDVLSLFCLMS